MVIQARESELTKVAELVKIDTRNRVLLPKALVKEGVRYDIFQASTGQIILDPQVSIPASEAWLLGNKELLALLDKSMAESVTGQVVNRGSFAEHVKDAA